jgi:hypothetical protein
MDIKGMLAAALRNFAPGPVTAAPDAAKSQLGQSGAASRVNANARDAYMQYAEREITEGRKPVPYPAWVADQQAGG